MYRIALILFFSLHSLFAVEKPIAHNAERLIPSVVKVKIQRNDNTYEESELIQSDSGGSGFVFDDEHHILTNEHVIKDSKKIFIIDHTNTEHLATLIAKDEKSDIAVLSVPTFNAPKLPIAHDANPSIGDDVFVIGAPYSLGSSVTVGVISALKRPLQNYPYLLFIQTDAAINPGNSGGPLFNSDGNVIAIATMTFAKAGSYTNIGFAIPIHEALEIADTLLKEKTIFRGSMGATLLISDKLSRRMGQPYSTFISAITPNGSANLAGLRVGDMIVGLNGKRFRDHGALHRYLYRSHPDESLSLMYVRDKKILTATLTLGRESIEPPLISNLGSGDKGEKLGLILKEINNTLLITDTYGSAKTNGFIGNDSIVSINGQPVKTIKELNTQLSKLQEGEIALITLRRNNETISLPLGSKTAMQAYATTN